MDTPSQDLLDYEDVESSLPDSDFNVIKLYNTLLELGQQNQKFTKSVLKNTEVKREENKINKNTQTEEELDSSNWTIKKEETEIDDATLKSSNKSENSKNRKPNSGSKNYENLLKSFFQPRFEFHNNKSPLKPFTSEFTFKFSNPVEKIQSKMREILRESSSNFSFNLKSAHKIESTNNEFDDFRNVEKLIKHARPL